MVYNISRGGFMTENDYRKILKDKLITYRTCLNIPRDITFGVEIEYENVLNQLISTLLEKEQENNPSFYDWINKREIDLSERNSNNRLMNGEINSPVLIDNIRAWKNLRIALDILNKNGAVVTSQCGGHVNIGAHVLGGNTTYWRNFILLWILYEKEIYKFSSGEFSKIRVREDSVIDRIAPILKNNLHQILEGEKNNIPVHDYLKMVGFSMIDKNHDIVLTNFISLEFEVDNRIEFRIPNGTLKEEIWQNYINFFAKFLLACKKELDLDKTVYKIINNDHNSLELADYIFEDTINKENFLIQALKTNEVYKKQLPPHIKKYY